MHDPGKIITDLAGAVALGGDCLAGIAVLREQPEFAKVIWKVRSATGRCWRMSW